MVFSVVDRPDVNSHYGIHDMAGFAKDSVGYYEAWWREDATCVGISISPAEWTAPVAVGTPITVHVTTCAPFAALYVNGVLQSLGPSPRKMDRFGFLSWLVPFKPGNISAFGYDAAGKEISSKTIVSAKVPKQLKLTVDAPYNGRNASQLAADGQDVVLLRAELLDSDGTVVPNADLNVSFEVVTGPAAVIGVASKVHRYPTCRCTCLHPPPFCDYRWLAEPPALPWLTLPRWRSGRPQPRQRGLAADVSWPGPGHRRLLESRGYGHSRGQGGLGWHAERTGCS